MIIGQIFLAGAAEEQNLTVDLGGVAFMGKASVAVLPVIGGEQDVVSQFDEFFIITTGRADKAIGDSWWSYGWHGRGESRRR